MRADFGRKFWFVFHTEASLSSIGLFFPDGCVQTSPPSRVFLVLVEIWVCFPHGSVSIFHTEGAGFPGGSASAGEDPQSPIFGSFGHLVWVEFSPRVRKGLAWRGSLPAGPSGGSQDEALGGGGAGQGRARGVAEARQGVRLRPGGRRPGSASAEETQADSHRELPVVVRPRCRLAGLLRLRLGPLQAALRDTAGRRW